MPDNILKKADSLEDMEMNKAKDHPIIGSEILGEIEELSEVASIVRHHHERYDGKGYPDGLKADAIPLFSRILFILDAYEALASDRVYRKGMSRNQALDEIKKNSGTQFDPEMVKIFLSTINEGVDDRDSDTMDDSGNDASIKKVS
jgi:HD-GYP domain-containing protein (c-di-GMP phosphodiesterase class II)